MDIQTLEKTEGAVKNGQSRDIGNSRHTRHRTKTNKTNKRQRKPKGQSRLDNPQTLTTVGTHDTGRNKQNIQTQHNTEN